MTVTTGQADAHSGSFGVLRRVMSGALILAGSGVVCLALLLGLLWWEHRTEITLPAPTGHFAVGRTSYAWVNEAKTDELAPTPGVKREVLAWVWYPAATSPSAGRADYVPPSWRVAEARTFGVLMSDFLTKDPVKVRAHSLADPGVSLEQRTYPVVVMRAGGGALTSDFTTLAEDLASHGYVVVGFDAPYRTAVVVLPDGRVVVRPRSADPDNLGTVEQAVLIKTLLPMWSGDAGFVVDQMVRLNSGAQNAGRTGRFTGRLDMQKVGIFGHSFGGATALQFCHDDARCKAGIDIDGAPYGSVLQDGLVQPFLFLLSDHGDLKAPEARGVIGDIESIYKGRADGRFLLMIRGTNHFSFNDQILLKSHFVIKVLQVLLGGVEARRGLAITTAYVHTFFDVYLKDAPVSLMGKLQQTYPEVQGILR